NEGERRYLDLAAQQPLLHLLTRQHIVERIVKRSQVGIDLFPEVARQEAQSLSGLDRGPREDDPLDLARHHHVDRRCDREIGLAGAGGSQAKDQLVLAERSDILRLVGAARADAALARVALGLVPEGRGRLAWPAVREPDGGVDRGSVDLEAALQPIIERCQSRASLIRPRARPRYCQAVAARDHGHAELALDPVEIRVSLA